MKVVLDCVELTEGHLLGITTDKASSNYSMTRELQTTFEASGIKWPALGNNIPCSVHAILDVVGAFVSSLGVKGHRRS